MTLDQWITGHFGEDQYDEDVRRCPSCGGPADERNPDEPCYECKVANAERIAEGDR
jgi:hypothetical protein